MILQALKSRPRFRMPVTQPKHQSHNVDLTNASSTPGYLEGAMGGIAKTSEAVKHAAVMLPLCVYNNVPSVLFIKRSTRMRNHTGQAAFPGGMIDPEDDDDPTKAALREMWEETGVETQFVDVLGLHHDCCTSESKTKRGTIITPVVGLINQDV